jgi:hypothetical protein
MLAGCTGDGRGGGQEEEGEEGAQVEHSGEARPM